MRSIFLFTALVLHVTWCYAFQGYPGGSWMQPGYYGIPNRYYNPYVGMPNFLSSYKIKEENPKDVKVNGLSDNESKPGTTETSASSKPPGTFYSISQSFSSLNNGDGKLHKTGETVINENGKITKFKL